MADLLSHALLAFALFTALGWVIEWLDRRWVVVGMVGSLFPDLNRIELIVDDYALSQLLGIPFEWGAIQTLGGALVLSAMGAVLFAEARQRRRAFGLLVAGAASHLVVDAVKKWADGANGATLYPVSWWRNPTPGWYVSSDPWVLVVAGIVAVSVWLVDRYVLSQRAG